MWTIAEQFNALVIFAEHRYYGNSMPYGVDSYKSEHLNYLTSEQALADYVYLLKYIKSSIVGLANSPVIAFGGMFPNLFQLF